MSSTVLASAVRYNYVDGLWIISSFFNPNAYITKPENFNSFIGKIQESGINHLIVELAFGQQPFTLQKSKNVIQVRTKDVMWQKERLLNIAISKLPSNCKYVAWIDCDIVFANPNWAIETVEQLKKHKIVQPFKEVVRLPRGHFCYMGEGHIFLSFTYVFKQNPLMTEEGRFDLHGHTGFAWASHKSILQKHGLYDVCIAGSADHLMAHSFAGDWTTKCTDRTFGKNLSFKSHYYQWSKKIYPSILAKLGFVDGMALHLWHGDVENRNYALRERMVEEFDFNPSGDLKLTKDNCWTWSEKNIRIVEWAKEYFVLRKEDG